MAEPRDLDGVGSENGSDRKAQRQRCSSTPIVRRLRGSVLDVTLHAKLLYEGNREVKKRGAGEKQRSGNPIGSLQPAKAARSVSKKRPWQSPRPVRAKVSGAPGFGMPPVYKSSRRSNVATSARPGPSAVLRPAASHRSATGAPVLIDQVVALGDRECHRLFEQQVPARRERHAADLAVAVAQEHDIDHVERRVAEQRAVVGIHLGRTAALGRACGAGEVPANK